MTKTISIATRSTTRSDQADESAHTESATTSQSHIPSLSTINTDGHSECEEEDGPIKLIDSPDTAALESNQITLLDTTKIVPKDSASTSGREDAEGEDSDTIGPATPSFEPLTKRFTSGSLRKSVRQQVDRQKFRRYQSDRFHDPDAQPAEDPAKAPQPGEVATPAQKGYIERGRAKAKGYWNRKRTLGRGTEEDSVVDILYENQRGAFLFGVPMFSSSSLLNFDPKSWQNATFRTSPVDIRNAQVPDPSWEWAWKSWYVDMSRDVDEEGWEYSFSFQKGFSWHGNHPWFHSFVRRRRWLRKRVRKHIVRKTKERGHELTAEYFTIHPRTVRSPSLAGSAILSSAQARAQAKVEDEPDVEKVEIEDIGSLAHIMRKAPVDRQKLVAVRKFVDSGAEDLFYLSDRMPEIMSLFIYQSSRRQLLTDLMHHFDSTSARKESLSDHVHDDDETKKKHEQAAKQANNLLKAVNAADEQVKKLEYWSDIKSMAQHGQTLHATDDSHWDSQKWQGLDPSQVPHDQDSFRSKQHHSELPPELHSHPEHSQNSDGADGNVERQARQDSNDTEASGYTTAPSEKSKAKSIKHKKNLVGSPESDHDLQPYATAPETPTSEADRKSLIGKGKAKASGLDGVIEEAGPLSEDDLTGPSLQEIQDRAESPEEFKDAKDELPTENLTREDLLEMVPTNGREEVEVIEPKAIDADFGQDPIIMADDD